MDDDISYYTTRSEVIKDYHRRYGKTDYFEGSERSLIKIMRIAIHLNNYSVVSEFVRLGFGVNDKDCHGIYLIEACSKSPYLDFPDPEQPLNLNISIVELLISKSTNVNSIDEYGRNALYISSDRGNLYMVKLLVEKGADINILNRDGFTPLITSYVNNHFEVTEFLLQNGAKIQYNKKGTPRYFHMEGHPDKEKYLELFQKYETLNKKFAGFRKPSIDSF